MIDNQNYVVLSLKLHLFFARIMKEHSIFLGAGFISKNSNLAKEADFYKQEFEELLIDTIKLSKGIIRESALDSEEFFTNYTLNTERKTEHFTGIKINQKITMMELELHRAEHKPIKPEVIRDVKLLNKKAKKFIDRLIYFKEKILNQVMCCKIFITNYPLITEHVLNEAKFYRDYIEDLDKDKNIDYFNDKGVKEAELFWNEIMMEHAEIIRGLLEPSESKLIEIEDKFSKEYEDLIKKVKNVTMETIDNVTIESLNETVKFKKFKEDETKGIYECKIRAMILPLLADHVLREANHYIRILENYKIKECRI